MKQNECQVKLYMIGFSIPVQEMVEFIQKGAVRPAHPET